MFPTLLWEIVHGDCTGLRSVSEEISAWGWQELSLVGQREQGRTSGQHAPESGSLFSKTYQF